MIDDEDEIERLGRLYPVILSGYNPEWPGIYAAERKLIEDALGAENIVRISHIGSTSIEGITAKPTIDILIEIRDTAEDESVISGLKGIGYAFDPQPQSPPPHMMFMKGYGDEGFEGQAYHVHVRYAVDWDELYFNRYLSMHPEAAEDYEKLKLSLKERYEFNREAYTKGKKEFVRGIVKKARKETDKIQL